MQNLERYKIFLVAAKHENFSKAAQELYVSQSSVSQAVMALEDSLGIKLFHRVGKRLSLTEEGRLLERELLPAFSRIERGEELLKEVANMETGSLRIGASDTLCRHFLLEDLKAYHKDHPTIGLSILNATSPKVLESLQLRSIDVGFINGRKEDYPDFQSFELEDLTEVFFTSSAYSELLGRILGLDDIRALDFVTLKTNTSTRMLLEKLINSDGEWVPEVEIISIDLMVDLIKAGFGVGFTYRKLVQEEGLQILQTDLVIPERKLLMITNKNQYLSPSGQAFLKECLTRRGLSVNLIK